MLMVLDVHDLTSTAIYLPALLASELTLLPSRLIPPGAKMGPTPPEMHGYFCLLIWQFPSLF